MTTVVGFDLALRRSGWAVLGYERGDLLDHGVIETAPALELSERLDAIRAGVVALVERWAPFEVGMEQAISYRSGTTTIRLGMVHGAVRVALWGLQIAPAEWAPSAIKRHATGNGGAAKAAVMAAAAQRWGVELDADESDAAFVASLARDAALTHWGSE